MLTRTNDQQVIMTNTTYDVSKKLVQIWLPAISAFYYGLGKIWGFPYLDEVPGSIAVLALFLGTVLNVSHNRYKESDDAVDGDVVVTQNGERTVASLEFHHDDAPVVLENKEVIKFRVKERRERPITVDDIDKVEIEDDEP